MGPDFLWKPSKEWLERPAVMNQLPKKDPEVKEDKKSCATIVQRATSVEDILHRFSSWHKLKKFVAWILRFKANLVKVRNDPSTGRSLKRHSHPEPLTVDEMKVAEQEILKYVQRQHYSEDRTEDKEKRTVGEGPCNGDVSGPTRTCPSSAGQDCHRPATQRHS